MTNYLGDIDTVCVQCGAEQCVPVHYNQTEWDCLCCGLMNEFTEEQLDEDDRSDAVELHKWSNNGFYVQLASGLIVSLHTPSDCFGRNCAVHANPSEHYLADAPLFFRMEKKTLERVCEHDCAHPDIDSAIFMHSIGQGYLNAHACDGCCTRLDY